MDNKSGVETEPPKWRHKFLMETRSGFACPALSPNFLRLTIGQRQTKRNNSVMPGKDTFKKSHLLKFISKRNLRILEVEINTPVETKYYDSSTGLPNIEHTGEVYIKIVAQRTRK